MMKRLFVPALALCAATAIGVVNAGVAAHASPAATQRSGSLHVTKECSTYSGLADEHCTITSSNVGAIKVGSRVVYLEAAQGTSLDSDIVLVVGPGNYALGHVTVDLATGSGKIALSGGKGRFTNFRARAALSPLGGGSFAWDGSYRFCARD
jgi:hypothetical protein